MSRKQGFGSLADLARIMDESANPESEVREDRKPVKKVAETTTTATSLKVKKPLDPLKKAWYLKRQKESAPCRIETEETEKLEEVAQPLTPVVSREVAKGLGNILLTSLKNAKDGAAPKDKQKQKAELWRRKPGESIF